MFVTTWDYLKYMNHWLAMFHTSFSIKWTITHFILSTSPFSTRGREAKLLPLRCWLRYHSSNNPLTPPDLLPSICILKDTPHQNFLSSYTKYFVGIFIYQINYFLRLHSLFDFDFFSYALIYFHFYLQTSFSDLKKWELFI